MSSFFLFSFSFLFIRLLARWFILPFQTKVACSNSALTVVHSCRWTDLILKNSLGFLNSCGGGHFTILIIIFLPKMVFAILCQLFVDYGPFNGAS